MPAPPSPSIQPNKRQRQSSGDNTSPRNGGNGSPTEQSEVGSAGNAAVAAAGKAGQSSTFRNVSACDRCRQRKNRCDQRLPRCSGCVKANEDCLGYDPILKRKIPRSYVFLLEERVKALEKLLDDNGITYPAGDSLEVFSRVGGDSGSAGAADLASVNGDGRDVAKPGNQAVESLRAKKGGQDPTMLNIVSPSKPKSLASTSGVSFARVVFAAVQYSVSDNAGPQDRGSRHPSGSGTSMRDSFFGLHTKPSIKPAPWPDRPVADRLVTLYFEHANPQIPILHRTEFMQMYEKAYSSPEPPTGARELYMLNMVFAIGCGVIVGEVVKTESSNSSRIAMDHSKHQAQPEEYHASAIVHLEACLSNSGGGLEVLQAVLLLANFALLRPVPPGLWYIIGVAVRLAVDLGLHYEEGNDIDWDLPDDDEEHDGPTRRDSAQERGRRLWVRDKRRRLWWCTYSFDRLVSTCVGRPFGISDQVITTEFPSVLDDSFITPGGFLDLAGEENQPSYKHVAHHYFRLRLLQSEILQVLQYNQAQVARSGGSGKLYPEMHDDLPCAFLVQFDSYRSWRMDVDRRLYDWKTSAPTRQETGVAFSTEFLELNYWQAIIMLYRQSLSVPEMFEDEYNTSNEVDSPKAYTAELREDEEAIYLKVAEAGHKILRIYRHLHLSGLVSYTYLSTHHLFMAGISYLYAIWHSPAVRAQWDLPEVDFTILAAKSVFSDMIDKCPPAETCRDAFDRTAKATLKMAGSAGGFGASAKANQRVKKPTKSWSQPDMAARPQPAPRRQNKPQQADSKHFPFPPSGLSSPTISAGGELGSQPSPSMARSNTFDSADYISTTGRQPRSNPSGLDAASMSHEGSITMDETMSNTSPVMDRRGVGNAASSNPMLNQQFGLQGPLGYPDANAMDFITSLDSAGSNGGNGGMDFSGGSFDGTQVDLNFHLNWEGSANDYSEGQQINPFDTFFFGGQGQ